MMNRCVYIDNNNNNSFSSSGDYMMMTRNSFNDVVCPKPRRVSLFNLSSYQVESRDSRAGSELLDLFLNKGSYGVEKNNNQVASSPPFFMGSPPSRASNPVVQDAHFGINKSVSFSPASEASPSPQRNNGGCARAKFGQKPAAVRIEGFNCRGNNCGISAVA
ncbi:Autophagy-related 2 [Heracleum sosnowskyi]|uniref:Autophagy-related 2 n=1 Tax=Heracleum sosnowskyi TaxID=360622 RepID=A0AAD8JIB6_9APIA|nr:Autophagy-related 2 [Heracleum sosnowskyi]